MTTPDEIIQAADHLVSVTFVAGEGEGRMSETLVGVLKSPHAVGDDVIFDVYTNFAPGSYGAFDPEPLGAVEGLRLRLGEVVDFTDHGGRADALLAISQSDATRAHALQALKAAEADLARAYQSLTNLTAQEG